jgi:flagellar basal-body rod protein FlgF
MDRLIYTAYSGLRGALAAQSAIANNLANANTVGFRADRVAFEAETLKAGDAFQVRSQATMGVKDADMTPGAVTQTGRALDLAVNGNAMIAVQADDGSEAYTRRGDLLISPSGTLQTGDGRLVLGNGGPISLPASANVSITADGTVQMVQPGGDPNNPETVDRIKLVSTDGSKIHKGVDGLFYAVEGGVLPADLDAKVTTGALEQSNVSSAQMMIEMIENQRSFDIRTKLLTTARDLDTNGASIMRISS